MRASSLGLVATLAIAGVAFTIPRSAVAATTIVNLNASGSSPNAGNSSPGFPYNPITLSLAAGTYSVKVVGIAGGGIYDAYTVYAPTATNSAYTDSMWSVSFDNGKTAAFYQPGVGRTNTASAALALYGAQSPYTFTLASTSAVSFYVDDTAYPYFGDDSGGVSLAVSSVVEPASIALLGFAALGTAFAYRRRLGWAGGSGARAA